MLIYIAQDPSVELWLFLDLLLFPVTWALPDTVWSARLAILQRIRILSQVKSGFHSYFKTSPKKSPQSTNES